MKYHCTKNINLFVEEKMKADILLVLAVQEQRKLTNNIEKKEEEILLNDLQESLALTDQQTKEIISNYIWSLHIRFVI